MDYEYEYDYDIIIIGAGLAGLYAAYNIKNKYPDKTFVILESNKRDYIGGRIGNETFYGQEIVVGAGVGRKDTDKLLIQLLHDLHIKTQEFTVNMNYSKELSHLVDVKKVFRFLKGKYNKTHYGETFTPFNISNAYNYLLQHKLHFVLCYENPNIDFRNLYIHHHIGCHQSNAKHLY